MSEVPDFWSKEIARLKKRVAKLESQKDLVVFYGSSSIRLWVHMKEDLHPVNTLNLAFGGSSFGWCYHYFEELFEQVSSPTKVVLYGGENDLSEGIEVNEILHHYKRLVVKIQNKYPRIAIASISVKPSPSRVDLLPQIYEINREMKDRMDYIGGQYIDIHPEMLDENGNPNPDLFLSDQLHMNRQGYEIWRREVRKAFHLPPISPQS